MVMHQKLVGAGNKTRIEYALSRLESRKKVVPGETFNLLVRKDHRVPGDHQEYQDHPGQGLLKRNQHWERVTPLRKIRFPREEYSARNQVSMHDLNSKEDFIKWFEEKFSDLPDGVYGAVKRAGKSHGYTTLFVLRFENGSVNKWQKKSSSQKNKGVGESAEYYALPWYFHIQERAGVTS